jgi:outer membrane protein OmpA-like peptidoglycan-associated protein
MSIVRPTLIVACATLLSGCFYTPHGTHRHNTANASAVGAVAGGALGHAVSGRGSKTAGTAIGAVVGAVVGGAFGRHIDQQEADLRRTIEAQGVEVHRQDDHTLRLVAPERISFASGSASLDPSFLRVLNHVAVVLNQYPETRVWIEGHTDNQGSYDFNLRLSDHRAQRVRQALVHRGVNPSRITTEGYAFSQPVASNATPYGRALNRRVEIRIHY